MNLQDYDFELPSELIAQRPIHPRDHARLLIYRRDSGQIDDDYFYNLPDYLPAETTLVLNNSKVDKARLRFGRIEVFVLDTQNAETVTALVYPGKKFKLGATVELASGITATVEEVLDDGRRILRFSLPLDDARLDPFRFTPLPPYIKQDESLADEYQTVYAKTQGSKAAPTAGLHFTPDLLRRIKQDWPVAELTLHVGLGTFAPLKAAQLKAGRLHAELVELDAANAALLNAAGHRTAIGTTSVRSLESLVGGNGKFKAMQTNTDIFIRPGYNFRATDALVTNFHLPKSSLLMLVAALTGEKEMHRIYAHAIAGRYRFYSFGDAMLVL